MGLILQHKETHMPLSRRILIVLTAVLYLFPAVFACAQAYTSIVVFGDSLSDTGNDATLSAAKNTVNAQVPGPATDYTLGRFTDGTDTFPAAHNYTGVWIEQLAAMFPAHPAVVNSLAGGTNYAYGFGTTDVGTTLFTYGPGNALNFPVNKMGQQITDYLATNPVITNKTLFVVWGGANDLINATSSADIVNAATRDAGLVQRLIAAGATEIIVPNLPPLGLVPRFNGSAATSIPPTQAAAGYNQALAAGLAQVSAAAPNVHIYQLDIYTLFNTIVGPPVAKGLANVTMSSQGNTSINPDTYLFWDDLHPTTFGHSLIAAAAETLLTGPDATTTSVTSTNLNANLNSSITLTASVTAATGTPIGNVTFLDGTNVLGTVQLSGSTTTATATLTTTTLTAATHTITAKYTGVNGYTSSTSPAISEIVTAPGFTTSFSPTTLTVKSGGSVTTTLTLNPVGGFSGTVSYSCGPLSPKLSCTFSPASTSLSGNNTQQTVTLTISTMLATGSLVPLQPGRSNGMEIVSAFALFPCVGFVGLAAIRRRRLLGKNIGLLAIFVILSGAAIAGLTGCGGNGNDAAPGSYSIPVTITANGAINTTVLTVVVQ
jgi:phospholipase/lecithinase/hemolysin